MFSQELYLLGVLPVISVNTAIKMQDWNVPIVISGRRYPV
jgi:hypothetical protein